MPATDQDRIIGARLRGLRKSQHLSQAELGAAIGVTFQQIQKYENGSNRVSGANMVTLCKMLKTTPDALLGIKSNSKPSDDMLDLLDDPIIRRALYALHELPPQKRSAVARCMMSIVEAFT